MFKLTERSEKLILEAVGEEIDEIAERIFSRSQENLVQKKWLVHTKEGDKMTIISDRGYLLQSGSLKQVGKAQVIEYEAPYAADVEYGQMAGTRPDFIEIRNWATRKLGVDKGEATGVAISICNKIEKEGTEPRPFLREAIEYVIGD